MPPARDGPLTSVAQRMDCEAVLGTAHPPIQVLSEATLNLLFYKMAKSLTLLNTSSSHRRCPILTSRSFLMRIFALCPADWRTIDLLAGTGPVYT